MFTIDTGNSGSEGPWLSWSARGTQDRAVPPETFYIRDGDKKTPFDATQGIVMDIDTMRTGWQRSDGIRGQAPEWKWNPSVSTMMPSPGEDYKMGFEARCAIGGGNTATWQQAGAGVWNVLVDLAPKLAEQPAGKLPLVRMTGVKPLTFKRGSTVQPVFELVQWVDRPDCLKQGAQAGIATAPAATPTHAAPPQAAPQPAAAKVDASIAF